MFTSAHAEGSFSSQDIYNQVQEPGRLPGNGGLTVACSSSRDRQSCLQRAGGGAGRVSAQTVAGLFLMVGVLFALSDLLLRAGVLDTLFTPRLLRQSSGTLYSILHLPSFEWDKRVDISSVSSPYQSTPNSASGWGEASESGSNTHPLFTGQTSLRAVGHPVLLYPRPVTIQRDQSLPYRVLRGLSLDPRARAQIKRELMKGAQT